MAVVRAEGVLDTVVDGQSVLINPAGTQVVDLNALGSVVWACIDGQRGVVDLGDLGQPSLKDPEKVPHPQLAAYVAAFLEELIRLELVQV